MKSATTALPTVRRVLRDAFAQEVHLPGAGRHVIIDEVQGRLRAAYYLREAPPSAGEIARVHLRLDLERHEAWIGKVEIAAPYRSQGLGRRIVRAAEVAARRLGIRTINLYPLFGSEPFWRRVGYGPGHRTARVLSKTLGFGPSLTKAQHR